MALYAFTQNKSALACKKCRSWPRTRMRPERGNANGRRRARCTCASKHSGSALQRKPALSCANAPATCRAVNCGGSAGLGSGRSVSGHDSVPSSSRTLPACSSS